MSEALFRRVIGADFDQLPERVKALHLARGTQRYRGQVRVSRGTSLLSRLFARYASANSFVRTRSRLLQKQEDVLWPMTPGNRYLI